jgi:hypothetical protein
MGAAVKDNTNAALKEAGKTAAITEPPTPTAPKKDVVPVAALTTTPCATTTPQKAATTTTPQFYTEVSADVILEVDDTDVFLTNSDVVAALDAAIAALLELPGKDVEITSITLVTATGRRLKTQGKVKAGVKAKGTTPAKVAAIAPKLPGAANKNLKGKGVPGVVGKATIPTPKATKKPNNKPDPCKTVVVVPPVVVPVVPVNPCAPVVVPPAPVAPVAPANPCAPVVVQPAPVAPVNPCAPVVKYSEQGKVVANNPYLTGALLLMIPGFIGLAFVAKKIRNRQTRAVSYTSMEGDDATGLE